MQPSCYNGTLITDDFCQALVTLPPDMFIKGTQATDWQRVHHNGDKEQKLLYDFWKMAHASAADDFPYTVYFGSVLGQADARFQRP